jgi:hypothetical protein
VRLFLFLIVMTVLLILTVLLEATTMGLYLSGHDSMLSLHRSGAIVAIVFALAQVVAALLYVARNRAARPILGTSVGMLIALILQMAFGFTHNVAVHIPLGVAIFGGLIRLGTLVVAEAPEKDVAAVSEEAEAA